MKQKKRLILFIILFLIIILFKFFFDKEKVQNKGRSEELANITTNQTFVMNIDEADTQDVKVTYWVNGIEYTGITNENEIQGYLKEGKNTIKVKVKNLNEEIISEYEDIIYYVEPYKQQFLESLSTSGVNTKIDNLTDEEIERTIESLNNLGNRYIRVGMWWSSLYDNGENWKKYDKLFEECKEKNINVICILGFPGKLVGEDYKISSENELKSFLDYCEKIIKRYPDIVQYELWNEPNGNWISENDIEWYSKMIEGINSILNENERQAKLVVGSTMTPDTDSEEKISSETFFEKLSKYSMYNYSDTYSMHIYDFCDNGTWNKRYIKIINNHKELVNDIGGFYNLAITEFGFPIKYTTYTEEKQSQILIQQSVLNRQNDVTIDTLYTIRNTGNNESVLSNNYGLLNYDYTPKPAYYAMKKYYENTNGAEYIGTLTNLEGVENTNLEAHVYDKDGKPKIIVWSKNSNETITIPYSNFKATDLYGEEIQPNEEGNLIITTAPIYLDDVEYSYFYQAISNIATENYDQFAKKFASEIAQVPELSSKIEENKNYLKSVGQVQTRAVGTSSIQAMQQHFELGNIILQAYLDGTLQTEDVKISSMLDMLNDIGDSYQDLVTVSAQTVAESDIEQTNTAIQEAEKTINNNQGAEIIYPVKILDFAKDHYEKATYINGLEEENDIKAGLIISNNLHALLLANWANTFAQINIENYIDEYITNNPVTIEYNTTELTNQNVKATIKTDAEIQITNNSNSKEHTFEQNGSFTFEYTIKGRALKITATVENIDKIAPTISGIQNGKLYTEPVIPKVNDKNLQSIELKLNSQVVSNYENGDTLEEEGFYEIIATDKAGNKTTRYFQIFINNDTNYKIEENYIKNVTNNTIKSDFDKKINLSVKYKITRNGEEVSQDDILATGDILTTETGDEYIIIVPGDINKDGKVDLKDFIKMRIYLLLENNLDDIEKVAADCNLDGQVIGVKDYIRMRLIILMNDVTN